MVLIRCLTSVVFAGGLFFWGVTNTSRESTMYPKAVQDLCGWKIRSLSCGWVLTLLVCCSLCDTVSVFSFVWRTFYCPTLKGQFTKGQISDPYLKPPVCSAMLQTKSIIQTTTRPHLELYLLLFSVLTECVCIEQEEQHHHRCRWEYDQLGPLTHVWRAGKTWGLSRGWVCTGILSVAIESVAQHWLDLVICPSGIWRQQTQILHHRPGGQDLGWHLHWAGKWTC